MDLRWWIWIAVAVFVGIVGYIWLNTPQQLKPAVLSLDDIVESRRALARTPDGKLEYRQFLTRVVPYFRESAHEFSYIVGGKAVGFLKSRDIEVQRDSFLVIPRRTALGLRVTSVEPLKILSFYAPAPNGLDEVQVLIGDVFPPGDPSSLRPQPLPTDESDIRPHLLNLATLENKELPKGSSAFEWGYLAKSAVGSVALVRVSKHVQLKERSPHFLYIRQGQARVTVGDQILEVTAGQVVILPNAPSRIIERVGDERLEFLLFSAPALREKDLF